MNKPKATTHNDKHTSDRSITEDVRIEYIGTYNIGRYFTSRNSLEILA